MYARRWFSAYAIINKISQAVRQAWSDIKALDSAMTNIAVVTDMSVSELWGKLRRLYVYCLAVWCNYARRI